MAKSIGLVALGALGTMLLGCVVLFIYFAVSEQRGLPQNSSNDEAALLLLEKPAEVQKAALAATQSGDLSISQTDRPDPLESGYLTYTLTVKHEEVESCRGCYGSGEILVTDDLPADAEVDEINSPTRTTEDYGVSVSCTGTGAVTCTINRLYDGDSVDIDVVVRATEAGAQTLTNTAEVSDQNARYPDPDTSNNGATETTQVGGSYAPPAGCESVCPNTKVTAMPEALSGSVSPTFAFASSEADSAFECKMDAGAFQTCSSPKRYTLLSEGEHTFQVRAKNPSGAVDPSPAHYTWEVDSLDPKLTFTEEPGEVTNDRSPTWAWIVRDPNRDPRATYCDLDQRSPDSRTILTMEPCPSPLAVDAELPDGFYSLYFNVYDKAGNYNYFLNDVEVDTVAPTVASVGPTGTGVRRTADPVVTFSEGVIESSAGFVNVYEADGNAPLAVWRDSYPSKRITISPKKALKPNTRYTVKVTTGVSDGANKLAVPRTWSFKTGTR